MTTTTTVTTRNRCCSVFASVAFFLSVFQSFLHTTTIISLSLLPTPVHGFQQQPNIYHPLSTISTKLKKTTSLPSMNRVVLFSTPASSSEEKYSSSVSSNSDDDDYDDYDENNTSSSGDSNNSDEKNIMISPYESLEKFLSVVFDYNTKRNNNHIPKQKMIQIVPQGFSTKQLSMPCQEVESYVFLLSSTKDDENCSTSEVVIAIIAAGKRIDISKVKKTAAAATLSSSPIKEYHPKDSSRILTLANHDQVLSICGFSIGNIPPPIGSFVSPLSSSSQVTTVIVDNHLFEKYDDTKDGSGSSMLLVFGGGYAYWRCILTSDILLDAISKSNNNTNIEVASIVSNEEEEVDDEDDDDTSAGTTESLLQQRPQSSLLSSTLLSSSSATTKTTNNHGDIMMLPIEDIEVPPIHIAKIVMQQRELSNPLIPSLVTITGRVGKIHSKRKQQVLCELLSIMNSTTMMQNNDDDDKDKNIQQQINADDNTNKDHNNNDKHLISKSWISKDGIGMSIDLIFGKKLIHQLGKIQALAAIENLKEGMEIQIQAKTNVESRDSLKKWVESQTLDLVVFDYQIVTRGEGGGDNDDTSDDNNAVMQKRQQYKHRPPSNFVTKSPGMPELTMNDLFTNDGSIHFVNDLDTLHQFEVDYDKFLSQIGDSDDGNRDGGEDGIESYSNLIGIDCEWQPSQFNGNPEGQKQPQPVLLMQVSLQPLEQIFVFDLQTMLRPLLPQSTPMNEVEKKLCHVLDKFFSSTKVFKAGYQISSDLKRIAASYPHLPCFQEVHSVLEVSALIKRILQVTKQKKSRMITQSLARMTEHYIGRTLCKEQQLSNWAVRPIQSKQLNYAALDAAVSPKLVEKALESINAKIAIDIPKLLRYEGDESLAKIIESWRFIVVSESSSPKTDDDDRNQMIQKLKAKRIVGSAWVVTQNWITGRTPPEMITIDKKDDT